MGSDQLEQGRIFPLGSTDNSPSQALQPLLPNPAVIGLNKHIGVGEYHIYSTPTSWDIAWTFLTILPISVFYCQILCFSIPDGITRFEKSVRSNP